MSRDEIEAWGGIATDVLIVAGVVTLACVGQIPAWAALTVLGPMIGGRAVQRAPKSVAPPGGSSPPTAEGPGRYRGIGGTFGAMLALVIGALGARGC